MLEQIYDNIIKKIQQEVVTSRMQEIPLTYLLTRNIPESVKHFFDQEVELWLREEAEKFSSNERFDYDLPEVQQLIDKIFDILKQTAKFSLNKFNQLLERAIKLEANYLIRPHQTLTQFLFKDSYLITTMDVYDMLKYFDKFQYYKDALTDYFNLKYMREISQNQFEELITKIDEQVYSRDPINTTLQTVKTIINFLNEGRSSSDSLPVDVLIQAFEDRNLHQFVRLVEAEKAEGTQEISLADLETLLRTGKTVKQRKLEAEKEREKKVLFEKIQDIEAAKPEIEVEKIAVEEKVEIIEPEFTFEEETEAEAAVEEAPEEETEEVAEETPSMTAADQLADVVAEKIKGDRLEDLNHLITPKLRKKFIKKVFRKDEMRYQEFIDAINKLPTWRKASALIDEFFYQAGINPYSKEALELSDLIYNRYFPKDREMGKESFS